MKHCYFLCYTESVPLAEVNDVFFAEDFPVSISPVLDNAFALATDWSPSKVRHVLSFYYSGDAEIAVPARSYALVVAKNDSTIDAHHFFGWPAEKPE